MRYIARLRAAALADQTLHVHDDDKRSWSIGPVDPGSLPR